ncbi:MAG: NAD(P)/FAD-dependent oxidoreductase [Actinobacteria bacterium]|nr:NAD(P)/FAD-dependent oxidoreductase [Actinomycetota bacterium]
MIDLLIVGAGPVGLVTAIHAAEAGLQVTVVEPRVGTIDKACGEGLMPDALHHLASIGIDPPGVDFYGIRYLSGKRVAEARFSSGPGRGVRRTTLHDCLWGRAKELNVNFVEGRVDTVVQSGACVEAAGIQSRYLIGADGLHSTVRSQLNLGIASKRSRPQRYGVRQHFAVAPWTDFVEVYWLDNAEVYVTPVDQQTIGVAVLGKDKINFDEIISRVPMLRRHLESAEPASKLRGAGPLRQDVPARSRGRVLLVGDAAGYVDALTGEGMRVGFAEGQAAVLAVLANDPQSYEAQWQRITRSYRLLAGGLLWASSNHIIRSMIVPAAQTFTPVFSRLVNTLG